MCFLPWWYMAAQRPPSTSRRGAVSVCAGDESDRVSARPAQPGGVTLVLTWLSGQRSDGTLGAAPSAALRGVTWRKDPLVRGGPFSVPGAARLSLGTQMRP